MRSAETSLTGARQPSTAGNWLHVVLRALATEGYDAERLALESGVSQRNLASPHERVPQLAMTRLWRRAIEVTGDPCFGLRVARFATASTFGALTHAVFASTSLKTACNRLVRYQRLMSDSLRLNLEERSDRYRLEVQALSPTEPPAEELDAFWVVWVRVVRGLAWNQGPIDPVLVSRRRPKPAGFAAFEKVFRAPVLFGADREFVEYRRDDCEMPLADGNRALGEVYQHIVARDADRLEGNAVTAKVRTVLNETMADGPTESAVAVRLGLSKSSLKAALAREGARFQALLDSARLALAHEYLLNGEYSIKEIAFLLGYSNAPTFSRAFKRWTGGSPKGHARDAGPD